MTDQDQARECFEVIQRLLQKFTGRLQSRIYAIMTQKSPIDTGFFQAGWEVTLDARVSPGAVRNPANTGAATRAEVKSLSARKFARNKRVSRQIARLYRIGNGQPIQIVNPVIYGPRLASGHSGQASTGWVRRGITQAIRQTAREFT